FSRISFSCSTLVKAFLKAEPSAPSRSFSAATASSNDFDRFGRFSDRIAPVAGSTFISVPQQGQQISSVSLIVQLLEPGRTKALFPGQSACCLRIPRRPLTVRWMPGAAGVGRRGEGEAWAGRA